MRILFAVHGYKPAYRIGGPAVSVAALAEHLVARGHEVVVFTTNSNLDEDLDVPTDQARLVDGVEVWYFRRRSFVPASFPLLGYLAKSIGFLYAPRMRAELDRLVPDVDIVHTHMPFVYPTHAAGRAALRHGKPLFYHQRGVFDPERLRFRGLKKRLFIGLFERPLLRRANTLVALTSAEVDSYRALGARTRCEIIPNGIDTVRYRVRPAAPLPAKWAIPEGARILLFLGRIHPVKGADRLLDAFLAVAARHPEWTLVMAGPDEFALEKRMRERAHASSAAHRVVFTGMVAGEEKKDLLASATLFALPSDAEGFSMAVLEALASGTAVLLSRDCHFDECAAEGAGVIAGRDVASLSTALERLLPDTEELERMGARGRTLVERRYEWGAIADRMAAAYSRAVAR